MNKLCVVLTAAFQALIIGGIVATMALADTSREAKLDAGELVIKYEKNMLVVKIDKAPLLAVVKKIEDETGARIVIKDGAIEKYPLSVNITEATLEEALKRIFKHYSYVTYFDSGGRVNKIVLFGAKASAEKGLPRRTVNSSSPSSTSGAVHSAAAEDLIEGSDRSGEESLPLSAAKQTNEEDNSYLGKNEKQPDEAASEESEVPYDLDEFKPLPEELSDQGGFDPGSEEALDPDAMRLAQEEQEARHERLQQAKLERSLSALNSEHTHLRSMAVEELVTVKDPRATNALASAANSENMDSHERQRAAQALWHQAADYQFADSTANGALQQLATDGDPEVQKIARRALNDMERYNKRYNRE